MADRTKTVALRYIHHDNHSINVNSETPNHEGKRKLPVPLNPCIKWHTFSDRDCFPSQPGHFLYFRFLWHHCFMLSVIVINPSISHNTYLNIKVMSTSSHNWRSMQDPDMEELYVSCQMCTIVCANFFSIRKHVNPDKIIDLIKS